MKNLHCSCVETSAKHCSFDLENAARSSQKLCKNIFSLTERINWIFYYLVFMSRRSWLMLIIKWELWGCGQVSASGRQIEGWGSWEHETILICVWLLSVYKCVFLCAVTGCYNQRDMVSSNRVRKIVATSWTCGKLLVFLNGCNICSWQ